MTALKTAIATYGHTEDIKNGSVTPKDVRLEHVEVKPIIGAFRRMVRDLEFDLCEMAPTTYFIARASGAPFIALPIFLNRRFHHAGLVCREDSGISRPSDLEGKRVGVRAYSVTTGVWTRGILTNEFGVDCSKITWVVDDEEHSQTLRLPSNVEKVAPGQSLSEMLAAGELDAGFTRAAGIGRQGAPVAGWDKNGTPDEPPYHELFPDASLREAEWFDRTGIYPFHGLLVIKESFLESNPSIAASLFNAFEEAKNRYLKRLSSETERKPDDERYRLLADIVGADPLPYGFAENLPAIDALIDYSFQQGLIPERPSAMSLFAPVRV